MICNDVVVSRKPKLFFNCILNNLFFFFGLYYFGCSVMLKVFRRVPCCSGVPGFSTCGLALSNLTHVNKLLSSERFICKIIQ